MSSNEKLESTVKESKNTNYYFGKPSTTKIPPTYFHTSVNNMYPGYPFVIVLKPEDFEEITLPAVAVAR